MAASVTYTFVPGTSAEGGQVNQNFTDITSFLNGLDIATVPVPILQGGTGATTAAGALSNLGLTEAALITAVPVPVSEGGTGGATQAAGRSGLGIGTIAVYDAPLVVGHGGTGAQDAATALGNLGAAAQADFTTGQVLAATGSQPFPGGYIRKWGTGTFPNSGANTSSQAITFAATFPTACFGVSVTPLGNLNSGTGGQPSCGGRSVVAGGFTASADSLGFATFNQTVPFYWEAWGH
jgi:hypothetical protein